MRRVRVILGAVGGAVLLAASGCDGGCGSSSRSSETVETRVEHNGKTEIEHKTRTDSNGDSKTEVKTPNRDVKIEKRTTPEGDVKIKREEKVKGD